jgi:acylpyruvate hydrolase
MKIVVIGNDQRVGALSGESVIDLNRADASIPSGLLAFIEAGQASLDAAQRVLDTAGSAPDGAVIPLADAALHAPWPGRRIACMGGNYAAHLMGMGGGNRPADQPVTLESVTEQARGGGQWGFWKVPAEIPPPGASIPFPSYCQYFDYEGEAAVIFGRRGKNINADRMDDYVWGVTLLNDWSVRDGGGQSRAMSYNLAKNFDGATTLGPCIAVGEVHYQAVDVQLRLNDQLRQDYNTRDMIWSFGEAAALLSRDFTFVPGDIISGGTSAGTAADKTKRLPDGTRPKDLFLKVGDSVDLSSPQIGLLRNCVAAAD